jgi:hypothetical protein
MRFQGERGKGGWGAQDRQVSVWGGAAQTSGYFAIFLEDSLSSKVLLFPIFITKFVLFLRNHDTQDS